MGNKISCQRNLFNIPDEIVYLNTAYISPLSLKVEKAINKGCKLETEPWKIDPEFHFFHQIKETKIIFSNLFNISYKNVSLIPSASYGISTAANNIKLTKTKNKILILKDQFPSNVYPWMELSKKQEGILEIIDDLNETTLTEEIINKISEEVAVVAIPNIRWTDGYIIDLKKVSDACKKFDVNLILDLTQSAGAMQIDLKEINPEFAIIANYKWMLGPYSTGFLYISDKFIDGVPLEETWIGRKNSQDFSKLTDYQSLYNSDSIRFDMGQRANFSLLPGVKAALEQLHDWSIRKIENTLYQNNLIICKGLSELGFEILSEKNRAPHFISARLPGYDGNLFINILKKNKIFISERSGFLRITPHLWNNEEDFFKLINCLKSIIY
tara:strand:- start:122 stop:1273 length:1152 start_codon:yes stop_codon:yes gene_type:complete